MHHVVYSTLLYCDTAQAPDKKTRRHRTLTWLLGGSGDSVAATLILGIAFVWWRWVVRVLPAD